MAKCLNALRNKFMDINGREVHCTLRSQTKIGENWPSSADVVLPPAALTRICLVIWVTRDKRSSAASSIPPIWTETKKMSSIKKNEIVKMAQIIEQKENIIVQIEEK